MRECRERGDKGETVEKEAISDKVIALTWSHRGALGPKLCLDWRQGSQASILLHYSGFGYSYLRDESLVPAGKAAPVAPTVFPRELYRYKHWEAHGGANRTSERDLRGSGKSSNSVCYRWSLSLSLVAALMVLPSWKEWPSSIMGMGLKLCGSASIVFLAPDQALASGPFLLT